MMRRLTKHRAFHVALIALVCLIAYSNTFDAPFQFDDFDYISGNPLIKDFPLSGPPADMFSRLPGNVRDTVKTRYMGYLSFSVNYRLHGLDVRGYHAANTLIHLLNGILLYMIVLLAFNTPRMRGAVPQAGHAALFASMLFVAHPLQTEAVTYITQRFTSLAAFFCMASLLFYIKWRLSGGPWEGRRAAKPSHYYMYALSIVSSALAMFTKENAFTFPLIIALFEMSFFEGPKRRLLLVLPHILTMLIIPLSLMHFGGSFGFALASASMTSFDYTRWDYFRAQLQAIAAYIRLLFLPVGQNFDYSASAFDPSPAKAYFYGAFHLGVVFLSVFLRLKSSKARIISFGIFWFFIALSVESSFIPLADLMFEHRVYLPSAGFFFALASSVFIVFPRYSKAAVSFLLGLTLILSFAAYKRNTVWQSNVSLWEDVVRKSPDKERGYLNLASAYSRAGQDDKAITCGERALKLNPDSAKAYNVLGVSYSSKGLSDAALEHFQSAIEIDPGYAEAHNNLGMVYLNNGLADRAAEHFRTALGLEPDYADARMSLAVLYNSKGFIDTAIEELQTAIRLNPDDAEAHNKLGVFYKSKGMTDLAVESLLTAVRIRPDYEKPHFNLGNVYRETGMFDKAIEHYAAAVALKPDYAVAHLNLGSCYSMQGMTDKAIEHFRIALELKPDFFEAHNDIGIAYNSKGLTEDAIGHFEAALRIKPDYFEALNNIAVSYGTKGDLDAAIEYFRKALKLDPENLKTRLNLGLAYFRKGRKDLARAELEAALKIDPDFGEARRFLDELDGGK